MDRDDLDGRRIDRELFDALHDCLGIKQITLIPELSISSTEPESYETDWSWEDFESFMLNTARLWTDVVIHDASGRWAIWMDPDATVFGTERTLANALDAFMARSHSSLLAVSERYYAGPRSSWEPHFREYFSAITKGAPA
jgi:hypothetical protein